MKKFHQNKNSLLDGRANHASGISGSRRTLLNAAIVCGLLGCAGVALGGVRKDFFEGSDLNVAANYSPAGLPSSSSDVVLTTPATALFLNAASLLMNSLNVTADNVAYTISNNTSTSTGSSLSPTLSDGNSISGQVNDAIFVGGMNSSLTIQGANGGTGSGGLGLGLFSSVSLDVAQASSTLNISAPISLNAGSNLTKTGAGVLNLSGGLNTLSGSLTINRGTTNLLPGFTANQNIILGVNNNAVLPPSNVILNVQTSVQFRSLFGSVGGPAAQAIINLVGTGTQLGLFQANGVFAGSITGSGSVAVNGQGTTVQTFSGNNTNTGTTTVTRVGLRINGITSGQGNYTVLGGTLTGSGTIGLAANSTITLSDGVTASRLTTGGDLAAGTLNVVASGTGGVVIGDHTAFFVDIGSSGASDLLAIAGGYIDLTSATDVLTLNPLAGAFDGSSYTIATFEQNLGSGVFNAVSGLPSNYVIAYHPTDIMLLPVPEPGAFAFGGQAVLILIWLRRRHRKLVRKN